MREIKNIIFDLGGVIINLSVDRTYQAFAALSGLSLPEINKIVHQGTFFHEYERGGISDADFRDRLRETLKISVSDSEIDDAWNAMLLDIPIQRIQLLVIEGNNSTDCSIDVFVVVCPTHGHRSSTHCKQQKEKYFFHDKVL